MPLFCILCFIIIISVFGYLLLVYTDIPILKNFRSIWIETAMTTADHQWLATLFFSSSSIDKVLDKKIEDDGEVGITKISTPKSLTIPSDTIKYNIEIPRKEVIKESIVFEDGDLFGNKVVINDKEQGIKIVEVKTSTYRGKLVFIDDPSRVFVSNTPTKDKCGTLILDYLETNNAILGINGNGFQDYNGVGHGGSIIGYSISNHEYWGIGVFSNFTTIGFDIDNQLIVGKLKDDKSYNLRDAVQFKPALIINGEVLMTGSSGWGLQPRTIVAQRSDGVVMFLVVDGRKPGYSLGITMGDAAELLKSYGAITAGACDGGSSSVLAYNGCIINKPSTPMKTGRYLPNALLVRKK